MASHDDLSERQRALLIFIEDYVDENGRPPTNREIGNGLGIPSTGHVDYHLKALEKKGFISRESRTSRGIRITHSLRKPVLRALPQGLRVLGTIAAGGPLEIADDTAETIDFVNSAFYSDRTFALQVSGDSMIEDGIFSGDYVLVEPIAAPNTRDIIVATDLSSGSRGAATVKRFFREDKEHRVRLQPANKDFNPIFVTAEDWDEHWQVQGRVVAIMRSYRDN